MVTNHPAPYLSSIIKSVPSVDRPLSTEELPDSSGGAINVPPPTPALPLNIMPPFNGSQLSSKSVMP